MRVVPESMSEEDKASFLAVSKRARIESVNCYTVLSLGVQAYLANSAFEEQPVNSSV